jgi:ribonuclease D
MLGEFLPLIERAGWVAIDTEADSLHAYPEKLCLLQVSIQGEDRLIDPLSGIDLAPLWLAFKPYELILHGADYDLRLLRKNHGFVPDRIFDTMLASRLLGDREFGLSNLVSHYLGVTLEKTSQKADWARRPLTSRMEVYARNDTHYLKPLADILRARLQEKGRLGWHQETCHRLIEECSIPSHVDPDTVWRVKGAHRLDRAGLAVLRELWHWREQEALAANKPPFFVLAHETLVDMAMAGSARRSVDPLMPRHFSTRRRDGVIKAVDTALALDPRHYPEPRRLAPHRQTEAERRRFEEFELRRNRQAELLGIDPTFIASRATLLQLATDWNVHQSGLMNWQRELLKP